MKYLPIILLIVSAGCTPGGDHSHEESEGQDSTNIILYNEVMDVHDEIMPRMEDLYNIRKDIEEQLKNPENMAEGQQAKLKKRLAQVDSVSKLMMDWMHKFDPPADTTDKEEVRAYLESEMEKIRIVKQAMLEAIAEGSKP